MPFTITTGEFAPEEGRPDGDSIRFRPDNPTSLLTLPRRGRAPRVNSRNGTIQLRFEGIDTMESMAADPFASNATASNLELCGVPDGKGAARGHILSSQIGPNGRPICFAYSGDAPEDDGTNIFLDVARMKESINFQQLSRGHAYPLFYDTLFFDLRQSMAKETVKVRESKTKVWSKDVTNSGATYTGRESLKEIPPFFPKLWRRLDSYSRNSDVGDPDTLTDFIEYLRSLREERVLIVSESRNTGFDDLVEVDGNKVLITVLPEDVVIFSS